MVLDHAGVSPNRARDRSIKLPREEREQINPPSAADIETVFGRIPAEHRLALLWLVLVGRARLERRLDARRRLRRITPARALARSDHQDTDRALGGAPSGTGRSYRGDAPAPALPRSRGCLPSRALTLCGPQLRKPARPPAFRSGRRTTCVTDVSRCFTCAACPGRGSRSSSASASCR